MTLINPNPEPFLTLILFPVKPGKDESLKSWLDRKNHQREYYAEVDNPKHVGTTMKFIVSKGTKAIFNNKDFGVLLMRTRSIKNG